MVRPAVAQTLTHNIGDARYRTYIYGCLAAAALQLAGLVGIDLAAALGWNGADAAMLIGGVAIASAVVPVLVRAGAQGTPVFLLCWALSNLAPIWFLYLEGMLPGDETAAVLDAELRIGGYRYCLLYMALWNVAYAVCFCLLTNRSRTFHQPIASLGISPRWTVLLTIFAFVVPLVVIGSRYSSLPELWDALTAGRRDDMDGTLLRRSSVGGSEAFLMPFLWLWQLTPTLAALTVVASARPYAFRTPAIVLAAALGGSVVFFTFLGGSRGTLVFVFATPAMLWLYYGPRRVAAFWPITITAFFSLIAVMEIQVRTRGGILSSLLSPGSIAQQSKDGSVTTFNPLKSHRDNNLYFLCLIVAGMPDSYPYKGFNDFFATIANPIPRAIWPGKPIASGALASPNLAEPVYLSGPLRVGTASISCTVIGEAYMWQGLAGFFVLIAVYAGFAAWFDAWYVEYQVAPLAVVGIQGFAAFLCFWGFRSFSALVTYLYPFLLLYFGTLVLAWRKTYSAPPLASPLGDPALQQ